MTGRVQIYTGNGKGKTTAALGLAVRAACSGLNVYIGQFMKGSEYAELTLPDHFPEKITIEQYGTPKLLCKGEEPSEEDMRSAASGLAAFRTAMESGLYDVAIADELIVTAYLGLIEEFDVIEMILARPESVELVLTGRYATEKMMDLADLVTDMREVKHYYGSEDLQAREGIEF